MDSYAQENSIFPNRKIAGESYIIRYDGTYYEIGAIAGKKVVFFCKKVILDYSKGYIDFIDIKNSRGENKRKANEEDLQLSEALLCEEQPLNTRFIGEQSIPKRDVKRRVLKK